MNTKLFSTDDKQTPKPEQGSSQLFSAVRLFRMFIVGTLTSLLAAAIIGYLGIVGALPAVQTYMENLPLTQQMLDKVQQFRVTKMVDGRFNVMVADLADDDRDGRNTKHVVNALADEFDVYDETSSIRVQRSLRTLRLPPISDSAAGYKSVLDSGRDQLKRFNGDLMVWGEVAKGERDKTVLRLRFIHRAVTGEDQTGSYALGPTLELPESFSADVGAALAAQVAADAKIADDKGNHVAQVLRPVLARLRAISKNLPASLNTDQRAGILLSYAKVAERVGDQTGDAKLFEESFAAYRSVLQLWTQDEDPVRWARVQKQYGRALGSLSRIEDSPARAHDAIAAHRAALEKLSRDSEPYEWASVQHGLCIENRRLADRGTDSSFAVEAVEACREAIAVVKLEDKPESLTSLQGNLGAALIVLGMRTEEAKYLEEGIASLRDALKNISREDKPLSWARSMHDIGLALDALGTQKSDVAILQDAEYHLRQSLTEIPRDQSPSYWAGARLSLARTLINESAYDFDTKRLEEAAGLLRETLLDAATKDSPRYAGIAHYQLARATLSLGQRALELEVRNKSFDESLSQFEQYVAGLEQSDLVKSSKISSSTGRQIAALSWYAIHARNFDRAIEASDRAADIMNEEPWMKLYRAHAYMFGGRDEEAKELYLSLRGTFEEKGGIKSVINADFAHFRRMGVSRPLMDEVADALDNEVAASKPPAVAAE